MLDPQDLEAISMLLDKKLDPIRSDIAELKQDVASLNERVTALELGQKRIEINLENEIDQCLKIMGDAYIGTVKRIDDLKVDALRAKVESLELAYKFMRMEIKDLKGIPQSA
jgi:predicted phage-related endonuclease